MTSYEDILLDVAMSEMYGICDSDMEHEEMEDELLERGFVESYDEASQLILKRLDVLQIQKQERHFSQESKEIKTQKLQFEDIFS